MLQGIFHHIDFKKRGLCAFLAATQIAHHIGRLQLTVFQQTAQGGKVILLSVGQLGHVDGLYTVGESQVAHGFLLVADGQYGIFTAKGSQIACRATAVTVGNDSTYFQFCSGLYSLFG